MDNRGRELFEVGQKPISNWQAPLASLLSLPYDRIRRRIVVTSEGKICSRIRAYRLSRCQEAGGAARGRWRLWAGLALAAIGCLRAQLAGLSTEQGRA
jgi:hypothetical protein